MTLLVAGARDRAERPVIPIGQAAVDALFDRYQNVYGQVADDRRDVSFEKEL